MGSGNGNKVLFLRSSHQIAYHIFYFSSQFFILFHQFKGQVLKYQFLLTATLEKELSAES
jgi:hypothetical protein